MEICKASTLTLKVLNKHNTNNNNNTDIFYSANTDIFYSANTDIFYSSNTKKFYNTNTDIFYNANTDIFYSAIPCSRSSVRFTHSVHQDGKSVQQFNKS